MDTHVKVLGILNMGCGVLGVLSALLIVLVFGGVAATVAADGDADAAVAIPIIGLTGMAMVVFIVAWSVPCVIIGFGLYRLRPWARIAGIVIAVFSLVMFPFGTLLGIYGLWVLFSKETERLFSGTAAAT